MFRNVTPFLPPKKPLPITTTTQQPPHGHKYTIPHPPSTLPSKRINPTPLVIPLNPSKYTAAHRGSTYPDGYYEGGPVKALKKGSMRARYIC
jgi:hypothetical protein